MKRWTFLVMAVAWGCEAPPAPAGAPPEAAAEALDAAEIREHMRVLSSDEYMGRGPGHPGGEMAAQYIADRFREFGLEPVDGSYFQTVPMIGTTPVPSSVSLSFQGPQGSTTPAYLDDMVFGRDLSLIHISEPTRPY